MCQSEELPAISWLALQCRIVGVALGVRSVEGCWVGAVERSVSPETSRQIGIRDEELAKGHSISFAFVEELLAHGEVDGLVSNEDASEGLSKRRAKAVGADVLAGCDEREVAFPQLAGEVSEGGVRVRVRYAVRITSRRQVHADAARPEDRNSCFGTLNMQTGAVFDGAAVLICPVVGAVLEELVEQVAVGSVEFDAIEAGELSVLGAAAEGFNDALDFARFKRSRSDEGALRSQKTHGARSRDGARSNGKLAVEEFGVRYTSYVPDLREDVPPGVVDGRSDGLPCLRLLARPETGDLGIPHAERIDGDTLAEDEARGGTLSRNIPR